MTLMRRNDENGGPIMMQSNGSGTVVELTDFYGRRYRTGVSDREILGRSRRWMFWLCFALMLAVGMPQYGYGVLVATVARAHGWSVADALFVLVTFVVVQAAVAFPAAWLRDRGSVSPRIMVIVGGVLCCAGLVAIAHSANQVAAVVGYGVCCGAGVGLVYSTCLATVAAWYPEQSAVRVGLVTAAFACGAMPFVALFLTIDVHSVAVLFDVVGIVVLLVAAGCGTLLREPPPQWWPAHIDPRLWALDRRVNRSLLRNRHAIRTFRPGEAVRSPAFAAVYALVVVASTVWLCDLAVLAAAATGTVFSARVVAVSFALLIGVNGLARAAVGWLSDRLGRREVLSGVLLVGGLAQFVLLGGANHGSAGLLLVGACGAALGAGCCFPLCAALVRDYFGEAAALQNFGIVYSAKAIGAICGFGLVAGTGGGSLALAVAASLGIVGALMAARLRQPGRPVVVLP
jgi:MFS family permease